MLFTDILAKCGGQVRVVGYVNGDKKKIQRVRQNKTQKEKKQFQPRRVLVRQGYLCNKKGRVFSMQDQYLWTVGGNNFV